MSADGRRATFQARRGPDGGADGAAQLPSDAVGPVGPRRDRPAADAPLRTAQVSAGRLASPLCGSTRVGAIVTTIIIGGTKFCPWSACPVGSYKKKNWLSTVLK